MNLLMSLIVRLKQDYFDECHRVPPLGASTAVLREARLLVGPEHVPVFIVGVAVQAGLGVVGAVIGNRQLVDGIVIDGLRFEV